eukprot:gene22499-29625_t
MHGPSWTLVAGLDLEVWMPDTALAGLWGAGAPPAVDAPQAALAPGAPRADPEAPFVALGALCADLKAQSVAPGALSDAPRAPSVAPGAQLEPPGRVVQQLTDFHGYDRHRFSSSLCVGQLDPPRAPSVAPGAWLEPPSRVV